MKTSRSRAVTFASDGPAPNAFVILPLVSAFFVDIVNVGAISLSEGAAAAP